MRACYLDLSYEDERDERSVPARSSPDQAEQRTRVVPLVHPLFLLLALPGCSRGEGMRGECTRSEPCRGWIAPRCSYPRMILLAEPFASVIDYFRSRNRCSELFPRRGEMKFGDEALLGLSFPVEYREIKSTSRNTANLLAIAVHASRDATRRERSRPRIGSAAAKIYRGESSRCDGRAPRSKKAGKTRGGQSGRRGTRLETGETCSGPYSVAASLSSKK